MVLDFIPLSRKHMICKFPFFFFLNKWGHIGVENDEQLSQEMTLPGEAINPASESFSIHSHNVSPQKATLSFHLLKTLGSSLASFSYAHIQLISTSCWPSLQNASWTEWLLLTPVGRREPGGPTACATSTLPTSTQPHGPPAIPSVHCH